MPGTASAAASPAMCSGEVSQRPHRAIGWNVGHLPRLEQGIDWYEHGASGGIEQRRHVLDLLDAVDVDPLAAPHASRDQGASRVFNPRCQRGVVKPVGAERGARRAENGSWIRYDMV